MLAPRYLLNKVFERFCKHAAKVHGVQPRGLRMSVKAWDASLIGQD